jgi:hypothetical protein
MSRSHGSPLSDRVSEEPRLSTGYGERRGRGEGFARNARPRLRWLPHPAYPATFLPEGEGRSWLTPRSAASRRSGA